MESFFVAHRPSCGTQAPDCRGSVVMACRFSCSSACGILIPWPRIELLSSELQGGFLTTRKVPNTIIRIKSFLKKLKKFFFTFLDVRWGYEHVLIYSTTVWNSTTLLLLFIFWSFACCMLSHFSCVQIFVTLWTVAHQAPQSMGFSGKEYWSVAIPFSRASSWPRDRRQVSWVSCIGRRVLYH